MEENLQSDISLWLSIAAFIFGGYSLWLTRKDRKLKHDLLKDYERAKPILEFDLRENYIHPEEPDLENLQDFYNRIEWWDIHFINPLLSKEYSKLVNELKFIAFHHPNNNENIQDVINGRNITVRNREFDKDYIPEVKKWASDWYKFIQLIKVETAIKEG